MHCTFVNIFFFQAFNFKKINFPAVNGHTPFKKEDIDKNLVMQIRQMQTVSSSKLRGITHIAVGVKIEGAKEIVAGSRSRAISTRDLTTGELARGDLCVNHKVLLPLASLDALRQSLLDKKNTPIKLMLINASDDTEIAECDIDLKKDILDKAEDLSKKDVVFFDFDGTTKVAKGVVDVALLHALVPLQAPTSSAGAVGEGSSSKTSSEMSVLLEKVEVDKAFLSDDKIKKLLLQVKWFGVKDERSTGYAPSATLPLKHEFKLDVSSEHGNATIKDLVSERLSQETTRGGGGDVQICLVAQFEGAGADKTLASGILDVAAMLFDGSAHGDGSREIYLVEGTAADAAATAAAKSGTKISMNIKFRQALCQIAVRMKTRQTVAPGDKASSCVVQRKEGAQLASKTEKESSIVVSIKSVELSETALNNTNTVYSGPLFLALDFFGDESDSMAVGGSDAYLRQRRLPISERFLCPVDSEHEHNRKKLKEALDKKDMTVTIKLFHEPWKSGARAWASGVLASSDFISREGADMPVQLKDEDTNIASVVLQVHSADALKMMGY